MAVPFSATAFHLSASSLRFSSLSRGLGVLPWALLLPAAYLTVERGMPRSRAVFFAFPRLTARVFRIRSLSTIVEISLLTDCWKGAFSFTPRGSTEELLFGQPTPMSSERQM